MKKFVVLLILLLFPYFVSAENLAANAKSAIMIEESSGKVLFENNADEKRAPASMTKVMTLLLIMEHIESGKIKLTDKVMISENASGMGGSQVFLEAGTEMTVDELIKAICIASGNDAAVAMAEFIGGSEENFVDLMNKRAKELGMKNTTYENPHGLDSSNHLTSARDMSIVARELVKHQKILDYSSTYEEYLNKPDGSSTWMVNTNKLIRYYNGLDGLKTGFTETAGYCLTATAIKNNMRLITVVMGEETSEVRNKETVELLNYGFANYKKNVVIERDVNLGTISISNSKKEIVSLKLIDDAVDLAANNEETKYAHKIILKDVKAPIKVGDVVGTLDLYKNGKKVNSFGITVSEYVKKANIWDYYKRNLKSMLNGTI